MRGVRAFNARKSPRIDARRFYVKRIQCALRFCVKRIECADPSNFSAHCRAFNARNKRAFRAFNARNNVLRASMRGSRIQCADFLRPRASMRGRFYVKRIQCADPSKTHSKNVFPNHGILKHFISHFYKVPLKKCQTFHFYKVPLKKCQTSAHSMRGVYPSAHRCAEDFVSAHRMRGR